MSEAKEKAWEVYLARSNRDMSTREAFEAGWEARKQTSFDALLHHGDGIEDDYVECPHCRGEGFLGLPDDKLSRGPSCQACGGMGKGSGCIAFNREMADRRESKEEQP